MPLLAALLLAQVSDPYRTEMIALLKEVRAAKSVEVRHVDGDTILVKRLFRAGDPKGAGLLAALEGDFLKTKIDTLPACGFHADVAVVTTGKRTLKTELCFGCGIVQITIPGPPMRRMVYWSMADREALKKSVHDLYPGIKLGR